MQEVNRMTHLCFHLGQECLTHLNEAIQKGEGHETSVDHDSNDRPMLDCNELRRLACARSTVTDCRANQVAVMIKILHTHHDRVIRAHVTDLLVILVIDLMKERGRWWIGWKWRWRGRGW